MSLLSECLEFKGRVIWCRPSLEMGWLRLDATGLRPASGTRLESPKLFRFGVLRFFSVGGAIRGVLGRVQEEKHPFDSLLVVAWAGQGGPYGFGRCVCTRWDIEVGAGPVLGQNWPRVQLVAPVHTGFGMIASSPAVMDQELGMSDEDPPPTSSRKLVVSAEYRVREPALD